MCSASLLTVGRHFLFSEPRHCASRSTSDTRFSLLYSDALRCRISFPHPTQRCQPAANGTWKGIRGRALFYSQLCPLVTMFCHRKIYSWARTRALISIKCITAYCHRGVSIRFHTMQQNECIFHFRKMRIGASRLIRMIRYSQKSQKSRNLREQKLRRLWLVFSEIVSSWHVHAIRSCPVLKNPRS